MSFASATVIKLSATEQLRIVCSKYKDKPRVDARIFYKFEGSDEFKPTKKGVSLDISTYPAFMEAMKKHGAELPWDVHEKPDGDYWIICKSAEDAMLHKKHVYASQEEAEAKTPPDGYSLFRAKLEKGAVVRVKRYANRKAGVWKPVK